MPDDHWDDDWDPIPPNAEMPLWPDLLLGVCLAISIVIGALVALGW